VEKPEFLEQTVFLDREYRSGDFEIEMSIPLGLMGFIRKSSPTTLTVDGNEENETTVLPAFPAISTADRKMHSNNGHFGVQSDRKEGFLAFRQRSPIGHLSLPGKRP
jgi:hypothetical protein